MVDNAGCILDPSLHELIGKKALKDFQAAGRCFAFGLPTAAGFHVCRAVEGVMEKYYAIYSGQNKTLISWAAYIAALDKIAKESEEQKPNDRTLHHLQQLKDSSRNPIMHPRVVLGDLDADVLISEGKNVMVLMALEIRDYTPGLAATRPKAKARAKAKA